jgi:nucleoside-diphosphate-sugar epimerase
LGLPLAKNLLKSGYSVRGSARQKVTLNQLEHVGIEAQMIDCQENHIEGNIEAFLEEISRLYVILPPGIRKDPQRDFVAVIEHLIPYVNKSAVKELVFTSSTGVFGSQQGVVLPETQPLPDSESGRQLVEVEKRLLSQSSFSTQILRLGGLIDLDRHPAKTLARKKVVMDPQAPVNLIHRTDAVGLLMHLPTTAPWKAVYHGVTPWHPSKKDFYNQAAKELGLTQLPFSETIGTTNKMVKDPRVENMLDFHFKEPRLGLKDWAE